jgi:2'-5' RNA ligase
MLCCKKRSITIIPFEYFPILLNYHQFERRSIEMPILRAFIAIDLPVNLINHLQEVSDNIQKNFIGDPIRWVPAANMHITLKFFGDVSTSNIMRINDIVSAEARIIKPFEISLGDFGVFPGLTKPRVIWTGVQGPDELFNFQRRVDLETARLGYASDHRPFFPHITIGRVSRNSGIPEIRRISETLRIQKLGFLGAARIYNVHIYHSHRQSQGPKYHKLNTSKFSS